MEFSSLQSLGYRKRQSISGNCSSKNNGDQVDQELYNVEKSKHIKILQNNNIEIVKLTNQNINNVDLDKHLSQFNAIGPIFEGMPFVRYSHKPINWQFITKEISSHHASTLPFKYLNEEKEQAYIDLGSEERKKRQNMKLKELKSRGSSQALAEKKKSKLFESTVTKKESEQNVMVRKRKSSFQGSFLHKSPQQESMKLEELFLPTFKSSVSNCSTPKKKEEEEFLFLNMKKFLQFQTRRKSCYCTCCGGDLKNQSLKNKSEFIDAELALIKELEVVQQQKKKFRSYFIKDITRRVQEFTQQKQLSKQQKSLGSKMKVSSRNSPIAQDASSINSNLSLEDQKKGQNFTQLLEIPLCLSKQISADHFHQKGGSPMKFNPEDIQKYFQQFLQGAISPGNDSNNVSNSINIKHFIEEVNHKFKLEKKQLIAIAESDQQRHHIFHQNNHHTHKKDNRLDQLEQKIKSEIQNQHLELEEVIKDEITKFLKAASDNNSGTQSPKKHRNSVFRIRPFFPFASGSREINSIQPSPKAQIQLSPTKEASSPQLKPLTLQMQKSSQRLIPSQFLKEMSNNNQSSSNNLSRTSISTNEFEQNIRLQATINLTRNMYKMPKNMRLQPVTATRGQRKSSLTVDQRLQEQLMIGGQMRPIHSPFNTGYSSFGQPALSVKDSNLCIKATNGNPYTLNMSKPMTAAAPPMSQQHQRMQLKSRYQTSQISEQSLQTLKEVAKTYKSNFKTVSSSTCLSHQKLDSTDFNHNNHRQLESRKSSVPQESRSLKRIIESAQYATQTHHAKSKRIIQPHSLLFNIENRNSQNQLFRRFSKDKQSL